MLCDHVGGDRACLRGVAADAAAGIAQHRRFGGWLDVTVIADRPNLRYELDEIEEWLGEVSPLIRRNDEAPVERADPWLAVAAQFGIKPPIDVEQRLAAMRYRRRRRQQYPCTRPRSRVTAALLNRGHPLEEIVATVLAATRAAAGAHADALELDDARSARCVACAPTGWPSTRKSRSANRSRISPRRRRKRLAPNDVISLAEERSSRQQKGKASRKSGGSGPNAAAIAIAEGVIEIVRKAGGDLLLTAGDLYICTAKAFGGSPTARDVQWLRCLIQQGMPGARRGRQARRRQRRLETPGRASRLASRPISPGIAATWSPLANGVLDLRTRKFADWQPGALSAPQAGRRATSRIRACPRFLDFMASLFADRENASQAEIVALLQEFFGACLGISLLNREHRRALMLKGPITHRQDRARHASSASSSASRSPRRAVREIGERFGAATFYGASAWIRDDAVNEGDRINPERFKTIVTGEPSRHRTQKSASRCARCGSICR